MAQFTDTANRVWELRLTAPLIKKIAELHSVQLTNLESDPLQKLRNDPMLLVSVVYLICQSKIESLGIDPEKFAETLPSPPDTMLEAVGDSIVNFYPSGRHSHVRETLTKFAEMGTKTDQLAIAKMTAVLGDTKITEMLSKKADRIIAEEMEKILGET